MKEKITSVLKKNDTDAWKLKIKRIEGAQGYYIQDHLEMMRAQDAVELELTVYKDFEEDGEKYRGSMKIELFPSMTEDEVDEKIKVALKGAMSVKNKWYALSKKQEDSFSFQQPSYNLDEKDVFDWVLMIGEDLFSQKIPEVAFNATEIFISKNTFSFFNSEGVSYVWKDYSGLIEFVTSAAGVSEEVELFDIFTFSDYSKEWLVRKIENQISYTLDRVKAVQLPALNGIPVVLKGTALFEFFSYFRQKASARMIFDGMSDFKESNIIQEVHGDPISIKLLPYLEGSPKNILVDMDGILPEPVIVIEKGRVKHIQADLQFGTYLGVKITGQSFNLEVKRGSMKKSDLEETSYLEAVEFSDFTMNAITGDFGGEIRLAYYFDGKNRIPVTGGSVTGKITEVLDFIYLSEKTIVDTAYNGPDFIYLKNISIAGG